ncbi:hypothetical protein RF55_12237 [Lasius niger]|uniref:Integrase catalytic domain-containing protein n=1 Tax=Lasius niger TaxID=67767 RepID=A0A0J7KD75_LASNI|nr:hypothetical protein RF55_12237 [Lasius niger]
MSTGVSTRAVSVTMSSPNAPDVCLHLPEVLLLPKLTSELPQCRVTRIDWPHLHGLQLADPHYDRPAMVDAILGAEVYGRLLQNGLRTGPSGAFSAQSTLLGWVLLGSVTEKLTSHSGRASVSVHHAALTGDDLGRALQRFWEIEELPSKTVNTPEDLHCEKWFATTHTRDPHGRYAVRLPIRQNSSLTLVNNRKEALHMLLNLERRLMRDSRLREQYSTFMSEYLHLGHMEAIPEQEVYLDDACYLPHHAVFKGNDMGGKIRVVFNASFRTTSGSLLNDLLLPGPKLQSELWLILSRWRFYRFAFTADIIKMFRQIRVHPEDLHLQRILWRSEPVAEVQDYRLLTVVYGTTSAPYLALRTLIQLADDEQEAFPLGSTAVRNNSYVDDILAGGHSLESALETQRQLVALLGAGGFELRVSTLGVLWNPADDCFALRVTPTTRVTDSTKRTVLSDVARFFDPLGWASPVLVYGKIFIQELWMAGNDWDQPLPEQLQSSWTRFAEALPRLNTLNIPRSVNFDEHSTVELHGFSDASSRAYAAAVYLRCTDASGRVSVSLLVAKTRVAPVRQVSVPRLELCGALLVARLLDMTARGLGLNGIPIFAWTDAAVVLAWIRSHPSRWKVFVANRVAEVQSLIPPQNWRYVPSADNPADAATRGISPSELASMDMWWIGPTWLRDTHYTWSEPGSADGNAEEEERRTVATNVARTTNEHPVLLRFSSLSRLLRVTVHCFRFLHNARNPRNRKESFVIRDELDLARLRWMRLAQQLDFPHEIKQLGDSRPLPARSPLLPLRPFLDHEGLLRLGGRLQHALLPYAEKHPLILAKDNHLSLLLVREAHEASLHGGPQLTRSLLLRRVWILQAATLVKAVIRKCVRCARFRAATAEQQMGQLPAEQTRPCRPFQSTGVDYAGPVLLRTTKSRGHKAVKGYICLFICLSSKAIHLEAVSDLSSASFLAAFKRFTARRGHCRLLISDNGTNFCGAARELRSMFKAASAFYSECATELANSGTEWSFILPGAPHFGGLWEAGVKSVKYHLRRILGEHKLTYEEMATLLSQIEACLNSRPLNALSNDPSDLAALAPGHLLIGESLKWRKTSPNLEVGALVLIKDELQPPAKWALARVTALHSGSDGLVRVVSLKTASTALKRPIAKLCLLPIEPAPNQET